MAAGLDVLRLRPLFWLALASVAFATLSACEDRSPRAALACVETSNEPNWRNFRNVCSKPLTYRLCSTQHFIGLEVSRPRCETGTAAPGRYFAALASSRFAGAARYGLQVCFAPQRVTNVRDDGYSCE